MEIKKDIWGVYNIYFNSLTECKEDIELIADLLKYRKFAIHMSSNQYNTSFECVARVLFNNIIIDQQYEDTIGKVLRDRKLVYQLI